jgi:hypothetical protein
MDGNNPYQDFDPLLHLSYGALATFALILITLAVMAGISAAAGVDMREVFSK